MVKLANTSDLIKFEPLDRKLLMGCVQIRRTLNWQRRAKQIEIFEGVET